MAKNSDDSASNAEQMARRTLIKLSVYVAPAIVGTLLVNTKAYAQASCGPRNCTPQAPCGPASTPCSPNRR